MFVNAKPAFDCTGHALDPLPHCFHAVVDELGLLHETGPKSSGLHSGTGAPDIEIDLIVPIPSPDFCSLRQFFGLAAPELQNDGVFGRVVGQLALVEFQHLVEVQHLGVDGGLAREQPHEVPEMRGRDILVLKD